jgi:DNA-directed RNA polymerase subunit beta'
MAIHPEEQFTDVKAKVIRGIEETFPVAGTKRSLVAKNVRIADDKGLGDFQSQLDAKNLGRTWAVPVVADLQLIDRSSGRVLDTKKGAKIADVPRITDRFSYIVKGNEYQVDNIWRRKPGVYSRVKENGELQAEYNLAKGKNFEIVFDPKNRKFNIGYENSTIPLYPVLKTMGVPDDAIEKRWGKEILAANKKVNASLALKKFNKVLGGSTSDSPQEAATRITTAFGATELSPETTQATLGKPYDKVNADTLFRSSNKLLDISRGKVKPDDRDALQFKTLHGLGDLLNERIVKGGRRIGWKIRNNLDRKDKINDIYNTRMYSGLIKSQFTEDSLAQLPDQNNPIDDINGALRATILGTGGISSEQQIIGSAKAVDPSHLGFMDTIYTPEGNRAGIVSHLALGLRKDGTTPKTLLYDVKKKKHVDVDAPTMAKSKVVMPDQVSWDKGTPKPKGRKLKALVNSSNVEELSLKDADFIFPATSSIFGMGTNLVPFLGNNSGNRISMAARNMAAAVPLKEREQPLIQAQAAPGVSWDKAIGEGFAVKAKEGGKVTSVKDNEIRIKTKSGKLVKQELYDNFPLNQDGNFYNHEALVKPGQQVKKGDLLADLNFTKDGTLAIGKNMYVGFLSVPGKTFEDGIVVSQSAAQKMASEHLYRYDLGTTDEIVKSRNKYRAYFPTSYTRTQLDKVDDEGVVKPGTVLEPGDPIMLGLAKKPVSLEGKAMARLHKSLVKPYSDVSQSWDREVAGEVVSVVKGAKETKVNVRALEPAVEGDKLVGRHGNKGIISIVLPDKEMPHDRTGRPLDIALNPYGVPGRMNIGQVYELSAAKIAQKQGKPMVIPNFHTDNTYSWLKDELAKNKVSEQEDIYDPKTGKHLGKIMAGPLYMTKMKHMVEHKFKARAGGPGYPYDINRSPSRGGPLSGQSMDVLPVYALLGHGAKNILRETHTYKSDMESQDELWRAMQLGEPLPPPKVPFVYKKFENYLKSLGVDVQKTGNTMRLQPVTDQQVKEMASGEVTNPLTFRAKDLKPEPGGIFDPMATKGIEGDAWSYYELPESMPNPLFEKGIQAVTGLTKSDLRDVVAGNKAIMQVKQSASDMAGGWQVVNSAEGGITGGDAIKSMLDQVDIDKDIDGLETKLPKLSGQLLDKAHRKLRYLKALRDTGMKASDAYMMKNVPIMPPMMRPVMVLPSGDLSIDNMNELYRGVIMTGNSLKDAKKNLPEEQQRELRKDVYDGLVALSGIGAKKRVQGDQLKGTLQLLHGDSPKLGFFQSKMLKRRQDLSARSTIVPNPSLGLDEVGIPSKMAMTIYKPFIVRELHSLGYSPLQAQDQIKQDSALAHKALEKAVEKRPVLLKRDPVLHKYGVMAFKPKIVGGKAIQIHPLITGPYGADFDGDTMAAYTPISNEAVREAWDMMPSNNLFSPSTGRVAFTPSNETVLGLYKLTRVNKGATKKYDSFANAINDLDSKKIEPGQKIQVGKTKTTAGRALIYSKLPNEVKDPDILTNTDMMFNEKGINKFLTGVGKNKPSYYSDAASTLMNLGNQEVYERAHSYSLDDFKPDSATRDKYIKPIADSASKLSSATVIKRLKEADKQMVMEHTKKFWDKPTNLQMMVQAGVKPNIGQYKQMIMTPVMMEDSKGNSIPNPITRSWAEGVDTAGMLLQSMGVRSSIIKKTQEVSDPGALTKRVMNTVVDQLAVDDDCGTKKGISLSVEDPDFADRYLASSAGGIPRGTLITPEVIQRLKKKGVRSAKVRSPSRCEVSNGVCSTCFGLGEYGHKPTKGTNLGVLAGQAIGEKSTQIMLKAVHFTGAMGSMGGAATGFDRVEQLLKMPQKIPDAATISTENGKITKVKKDPAGGYDVDISGKRHYVPQHLGLLPGMKVGSTVKKGEQLSGGQINVRDLLPVTGINGVRDQIAGELGDIYGASGVRRRNVELLAKAVTNLSQVRDPGDNAGIIRGDYIPISAAEAYNAKESTKKPIRYQPILKGVNELPHAMGEDWLARLNHTKIKDTIIEAANQGWVSNLHSTNPIPALAHGSEFGKMPFGY